MRDKIIVRTSIIGIIANVFLAGFKAAVGAITSSIAITLDAVNNLSDALSSIITIIGTKLASKPADKEHPFGHGRVEYLGAMVIGVIILYAGVTALIESIKRIMDPTVPSYNAVSLAIVGVAVLVKIILGRYVTKVGKDVNSSSLVASGQDATLDAIISASTLVAAGIFIGTGVSLEAYLGAVISLVIMKAGIDTLKETISSIEGERLDSTLSKEIKQTVASFEDVQGAYDLIIHNYGPDRYIGSVHIEIPDYYTADKIDDLTRKIQDAVYAKHGIALATVGIYSQNTTDDRAAALKTTVTEKVMSHDGVLQMHGFYLDIANKKLSFDVIVDFAAADRLAVYNAVCQEIQAMLPDYNVQITMDSDVSD